MPRHYTSSSREKLIPISKNTKATQKRQSLFFFYPCLTPLETQYLHLATFNLLPPPPPCPPPPSSPSPTHIFSLTVPVLSRIDFSLRSDSLPSLKEGRKEAVCVFSLKFLSQNYNTLKGETHRHEKAVPCQRGFLAITARVEGVVQGTRQPESPIHGGGTRLVEFE